MRNIVDTGLWKANAPLELAAVSNNTLYVCCVPTRDDGTVEPGGFVAQLKRTMSNLKQAVEAAGSSMSDVFQVQVYLSSAEFFPILNETYAGFFSAPYPVRATFIVGLIVPGADVEVLAQARVHPAS